jgi:signal transduction histidine kinase
LANGKKTPLPVNGVLDLREWDFERDGNIELKGYWEFYYGDFLSSIRFDTLQSRHFAWVPGVWKRGFISDSQCDTVRESRLPWWPKLPWENYDWKGARLGATGHASYRLTVLFPPDKKLLAFKVQDEGTAYSFFLDDSLVASNGRVGKSKTASLPQYHQQTVILEAIKDTMELTFWISNFHYRKGGFWKSVILGDAGKIKNSETRLFNSTIFITGVWFMVSFIMFCFFVYRPREKSIMFLFLYAFWSLIRMISSDDRIITYFFPGIGFELLVKMELISLYLMIISGTNAIFSLYPKETSRKIGYFFTAILSAIVFITIITPPRFHSNFVVPFQFTGLAMVGYSNYILLRAVARKREGAILITTGFALMSIVFFLQIPYYNQLSDFSLNMYTAYGFIFALIQVLLLAGMFSRALRRAESFASELEDTVNQRTRELMEAQEKLIEVARQSENERIRQRISQDIHDDISSGLNKISWLSELMKIKAQKNIFEEINPILDKIIKSSRESVDNLIEIIWSLNPKYDDLENMLLYMRNYINRFFDESEFNVIVNFPEHPDKLELNPELKRNLFLVMKEALNNAAKYSKAENIVLDFQYKGIVYLFIISDDGVGIETGIIHGTGNGMINMRKRMEEIHGSFKIESDPGIGTRITLEGEIY